MVSHARISSSEKTNLLHWTRYLHGFLPFLTKDSVNQLEVLSIHQAESIAGKKTKNQAMCCLQNKL